MLRGTGGKTHVSNTGSARVPFCGGNGLRVGINPVNPCSERCHAECEAAVTAPDVQDALPAHEGWAAPLPELVRSAGPEGRRQRRDVPAEIADRARCEIAHGCVQLKPGRAGEIRTCFDPAEATPQPSDPTGSNAVEQAPRRALSTRTPTSRCRSATAGRRVRARESPPGAGRAATGTRVALRSRPLLPARQHVRS
jgi:hypothetical protein